MAMPGTADDLAIKYYLFVYGTIGGTKMSLFIPNYERSRISDELTRDLVENAMRLSPLMRFIADRGNS